MLLNNYEKDYNNMKNQRDDLWYENKALKEQIEEHRKDIVSWQTTCVALTILLFITIFIFFVIGVVL